jgi:hypothetical protein
MLKRHELQEPKWVNTEEHEVWAKKMKELEKQSVCFCCGVKEWCPFYKNNLNEILCVTEILKVEGDKIYVNWDYSREEYRKYRIDSYLFKKFIQPKLKVPLDELKELQPIKTKEQYKKLEDFQYGIYEKVIDKVKGEKQDKVIIFKGILDNLLREKDEDLLGKILSSRDSLHGLNYRKVRSYMDKNKLNDTGDKFIEVDFAFWREWVRQQKLKEKDVLYSWYLSLEKNPSRRDLEDMFGCQHRDLIEMERRLVIRKDFRNIGKTQLTNNYIINTLCVNSVFRWLTESETKEYLKGIAENNKRMAKKHKNYNAKGQPKFSQKELDGLDELRKKMKCGIIENK